MFVMLSAALDRPYQIPSPEALPREPKGRRRSALGDAGQIA